MYDIIRTDDGDFAPEDFADTERLKETDEKGRLFIKSMSDRELLEEAVATARATTDLVEKFIGDFAKNPMMGTMLKMFGR